jgi:hypothetical protein
VLLPFGLLVAWPLSAQEEGEERANPVQVKHRNNCRLAAQVLLKGQPAVKRDWALRYIGSCAQQQEVVLEMWKEPPVAQEELSRLFELSRKIRDRRIFRRAAKIADDVSADSDLRITALGVLGSYLDSNLVMELSDLERREEVAGIRWSNIFGVGGDLESQETVRPLPADAEARIRTLVRRLARQADDDVVRAQAWHLATRVGIDVEAPR